MDDTTPRALQGLRVIEMGQLVAGPFAELGFSNEDIAALRGRKVVA